MWTDKNTFLHRPEFAEHQARADAVEQAFGRSAPAPMPGESAPDYQRRLLSRMQEHSPSAKSIDLRQAPDEALAPLAAQIYADAEAVARRPAQSQLPERITMVTKVDPYTGIRENTFVGRHTFFRDMAPPGRRMVTHIKGPREFAREEALSRAGL